MRNLINLFIVTLIISVLYSCSEDKSKQENKEIVTKRREVKKKKKKTVEKQEMYPVLNNENVVEFLTKYGKEHTQTRVLIKTSMGDIKIRLYKETPLHRANFLYLIEREYFSGTVFYRVVKDFVVQGGNSDEMKPTQNRAKIGKYTLPSEFISYKVHKKGTISIAREYENNPDKRSSPYDFFLVQGKVYIPQQLRGFSKIQQQYYSTIGGAYNLDMEHTVFGEVIKGLNIVDKIADVKVDAKNWPVDDVYILKIEVMD